MATSNSVPGGHTFDNIINFRDVGTFINHITGRDILKPGLLYRSARPDAASNHDREVLLNEIKLKTIVDLRTKTEHSEAKNKFAARQKAEPPGTPAASETAALPSLNPDSGAGDDEHAVPATLRIDGIKYEDVDLNGKPYSNALLKQLSWRQRAKLYSLYVLGYHKEAISILGTHVMAARGLSGLAEDSLEHCGGEVKALFDLLSDEKCYPLLAHCTQGKDRTGLTVLLVLMLCDVPLEAIDRDYMLSEKELLPERQDKVKEIASIGLPDSFADCEEGWAGRVSGWVDEKYGGIGKYLERCGVRAEQQEKVRKLLMV
ncbi:hypothetical protein LTR86_005169 [Recurvomyces mirabilis]|nr:hypothetical protein LTR86_005169 [Recurvomyces mirabilis]